MPVSWKRRIKVCVIGVVVVLAVTLFCLAAVSSPHFDEFCFIVGSLSRSTITSPAPVDNSSDICTADVFRDYYRTKDYFPAEGRWTSLRPGGDNVSAGTSHRFVPDLCKFHFDGFRSLPSVNARRCLRRRNVTHVTTVGDSNAARYYAALLAALSDGDWRCVDVAAEAVDHTLLVPDVRYFARHDRALLALLRATARHCSSCVSRSHRCRRQTSDDGGGGGTEDGSDGGTLWMEHVSMTSVLDSSIKIDVPHNQFVVNLRYRADTFQVACPLLLHIRWRQLVSNIRRHSS